MNREEYIDSNKRDRVSHLVETMEAVSGYNPVDESRRRIVVNCRAMVAYVLLLEGWTEHQVGQALGWDHSTIHHYRKKFVAMMTTPGYKAEREIWGKFKNAI